MGAIRWPAGYAVTADSAIRSGSGTAVGTEKLRGNGKRNLTLSLAA